jgi:hypothetical protein
VRHLIGLSPAQTAGLPHPFMGEGFTLEIMTGTFTV